MGRAIIAEDGIEEYGEGLVAKKELVVGLIFGQEINATKTCVVHLARSPAAEEADEEEDEGDSKIPKKAVKSPKKDDFDDSVVLDHVRQVMRSLPGGITVLGLFIVSSTDPFQSTASVARLRKLLTSVDVIVGKSSVTVRQQLTCERIVLHICNTSIKYNCKTIDIASPISSPKPADWKFVNTAGSPWMEIHCTLNVEFFIALSDSESSGTLRKQLDAGIELYSKAVKNCICLIDGEIKSESELLDSSPAETSNKSSGGGKKKHSKQASNSEERMKTVNVQILIPEPEVQKEKQECSSDLRFGGQMCIKAYLHGKATVREACQVIKEDILRSLWARCDMHCDSLIGEEQRGQPDVRAVLHEPPRRVLAPLPYSPISVSDYLFPGEGPADSLASLADLLDLGTLLEGDVQDYWEAAAEVNEAVLEAESATQLDTTVSSKQTVAAQSTPDSRAILISGLIALLAIALSYLTLQIFRSN